MGDYTVEAIATLIARRVRVNGFGAVARGWRGGRALKFVDIDYVCICDCI
jgi:hypothetical protein